MQNENEKREYDLLIPKACAHCRRKVRLSPNVIGWPDIQKSWRDCTYKFAGFCILGL